MCADDDVGDAGHDYFEKDGIGGVGVGRIDLFDLGAVESKEALTKVVARGYEVVVRACRMEEVSGGWKMLQVRYLP